METSNTITCPQQAQTVILAASSGLGSAEEQARHDAHLSACPACAALAQELQAQCRALRALPVRQTSPEFEAKLAARLAALDAPRPALTSRVSAWRWPQAAMRFARPTLALGAAVAVAVGVALFERPAFTPVLAPTQAAADRSLVSHCVRQHQTDASALPLSDPSAQNLAAQVDDANAASLDAATAGEDAL